MNNSLSEDHKFLLGAQEGCTIKEKPLSEWATILGVGLEQMTGSFLKEVQNFLIRVKNGQAVKFCNPVTRSLVSKAAKKRSQKLANYYNKLLKK